MIKSGGVSWAARAFNVNQKHKKRYGLASADDGESVVLLGGGTASLHPFSVGGKGVTERYALFKRLQRARQVRYITRIGGRLRVLYWLGRGIRCDVLPSARLFEQDVSRGKSVGVGGDDERELARRA